METTLAQVHGEGSASTRQPRSSLRVISVDTLRGLTILLMIFVNDLGRGAPAWMHHIRPPRADGMTLADIVFPFFLFIVGVSIPLAQERRRGVGRVALGRSLATSSSARQRLLAAGSHRAERRRRSVAA